jgi:thiamine kinase-like enzyme
MVGELNAILERLESSLGPLSGAPCELDGGITNRNFRVTLGGEDCVLRRPGKETELLGIDREAERLANQTAAELGFAPAVLFFSQDGLVTRFVACHPVDSAEIADGVEEIARDLRRFHDSGVRLPARFSVPELLDDYAAIIGERGGELPPQYEQARDAVARIAASLAPERERPCHNDLLAGNVIRERAGGRLMVVDWEYAGMGDPRFDLGNLSVNNGFDEASDERLLHAYYGASPSDSQMAALQLMRVLSDAREAAWGVVQAQISALDFDFQGYAEKHFERLREAVTRPRFEECLASAGE